MIKEKILSAIAEMSAKVTMDKRHRYTDNETGLFLQGVSSVSSIVPKDWLSAWGAKECAKFLGYSDYEGDTALAQETLDKAKTMSAEEWIAYLKQAKGASARKSGQALIDGKAGHQWLEDYVKARAAGLELPAMPVGPLERPITQFLEWEGANIQEWIASEAVVSWPNREVGYAGTLDAIAITKEGKLALIDFKFASNISEDYYLQTAGYAATFEPYGITFEKRIIIRLPKTLEKEEYDKVNWCYKKKWTEMLSSTHYLSKVG
jgi:hypothetical protein